MLPPWPARTRPQFALVVTPEGPTVHVRARIAPPVHVRAGARIAPPVHVRARIF
jgi:hypothetical protein